MPLLSRKSKAEKTADLVKSVVAELAKANNATVAGATRGATQHVVDMLPTNEDGSARTVADLKGLQDRLQTPGSVAMPMPRGGMFDAQLGPGRPYIPTPLDPVDPVTGRAMPRRYEYQVAINLDLTRRRVPWSILRSLSDDCDLIHRCAEIRTSEIVGLNWDFAVSDHAITRIMADNSISISEAQKIGRTQFAADIDKQKAFWENPDQNADVGFSEWMTEALDQHFTYDGLAVYPRFNLGGALIGLEVIDAPTIKVLRDNRGGLPLPPYPAYQQVLWGFPRGEFHASAGVPEDKQFLSDQLSYFVRNRKTHTPYGYSTVEESMIAAVIYLERQAWMRGEYTQGTSVPTWIKTDLDPDSHTPQQLRQWERVVNDELAGQNAERMRNKLLPKGFDPVQMQMASERYTAAYDEYLIKQVGSKWGIAPTQLGVIPTTGLSGRGQQEGEQDQADTISKRPTEEWLADVINSMSRRYLGTTRDTGITFNDPQTSDDDLAVAQAQAARVNAGIRTINAIAIENGDPSFDMPEADEPFVLTSTGPVFLRGLLEQQQKEGALALQPKPAPVVAPPGAFGAPAPLSPANDSGDDLADETAKFVRFAANRRRNGAPWRDFAFKSVEPDVADDFNELASQGDIEALRAKVVDYVKKKSDEPLGDSRPGPGGHREYALVEHFATKVAAALGAGLDAHDIATRWAKLGVTKATVPDDLSAPQTGAEPPQLAAARAFVTTLQTQLTSLQGRPTGTALTARLSAVQAKIDELNEMVDEMYRSAYVAGAKSGVDSVTEQGGNVATTDLADAVTSIDWDAWTPGDPVTAGSVEGDGLSGLLARSGVVIKDIDATTMDDLAQVLANGIAQGDSIQTMTANLQGVIDDPARARMIARTEVNRAMTLGSFDIYRQSGVSEWNWLASPKACPKCRAKVEENPHQLGDDGPPLHPNCRCASAPIVNMN